MIKLSIQLKHQRAQANDPCIIKNYFSKLSKLVQTHGLKAQQIFNMDEKGFLMGQASRAKVICRHGRRNPWVTHDGGQKLVTMVETVSAAGCNMYTCSGNCIQERSAGFPMFSLITLLTLISLIVLQPRSYIKAR